ncbi:hypothetical protein MMC07_007450 [Pseudocyphellaria aurata]|nr:hypothetical protein [Pseudocyphellaria aurata]
MSDEIFDYIYVALCRRLFSLAWYDDFTYATASSAATAAPAKALPDACYNGLSCQSPEPNYL